jgi:hypothetical protein
MKVTYRTFKDKERRTIETGNDDSVSELDVAGVTIEPGGWGVGLNIFAPKLTQVTVITNEDGTIKVKLQ